MHLMRWEVVIGRKIRELRKARALSQEGLAHDAGIAMRYLAGIERGEENPSLSVLVKLSTALGIQPGALFED